MLPGMMQVGFYGAGGGASGPAFVGSASNGSTSSSYSVDISGIGIAPGDIVVVLSGYTSNGTDVSSITCTGNNNGAYSINTGTSNGADSWDTTTRLFYNVQGATPDTSLSITRAAAADRGGATVVQVWRNIDPVSPIDTTGTAASGINTGRGNPPAITPTSAGAIIIAAGIGAQTSAGSAFAVPGGMLNGISHYQSGSTAGVGVLLASDVWVSGSYDPAAWTGGADDARASWIAQTIALKPA